MAIRDNTVLSAGLAFLAGRQTVYVAPGLASTALVISASTAGGTQGFTLHSIREVSRQSAIQATDASRPTFGGDGGAGFDGTADNLLTGYTAGSGANFLVARVTMPASLASDRIVLGTQGASDGRFWLGFDTTGKIIGGVGANSGSVIVGASSYFSQTIVIGLSNDGANVRLFGPEGLAYSGAQSGAVNTTVPLRIGARNNNGTAADFWPSNGQVALAGREFIDEARFRQIANALG
jgi:hypothetical protein